MKTSTNKKPNSFTYLGQTFTAGRKIKQRETDKIFHTCCGIGISNYKDNPFATIISSDYSYTHFYEMALDAGLFDYDTFIMNGVCEVIPFNNELFAINKAEATKFQNKQAIKTESNLKKADQRHLSLTHEEIELIIHALGIASDEYSAIYSKICTVSNTRNNVRHAEQCKEAQNIYHKKACDFADLNCAIANSEKDV